MRISLLAFEGRRDGEVYHTILVFAGFLNLALVLLLLDTASATAPSMLWVAMLTGGMLSSAGGLASAGELKELMGCLERVYWGDSGSGTS